jgi:hypothetical protein
MHVGRRSVRVGSYHVGVGERRPWCAMRRWCRNGSVDVCRWPGAKETRGAGGGAKARTPGARVCRRSAVRRGANHGMGQACTRSV